MLQVHVHVHVSVFSRGNMGPIRFVSINPFDVVVGVARMLSCGTRSHLPICLSDFLGKTLSMLYYPQYMYVHIYMYVHVRTCTYI